MDRDQALQTGVTLGSTLAVVLSWEVNHSIIWAALHSLLSWVYVLYWAILYR